MDGNPMVTGADGVATNLILNAGPFTLTEDPAVFATYLGAYVYCSEQGSGAVLFDGTAEAGSLSLGREGNTMNFPDDRFISGHHARLDESSDGDAVLLTDTGSRNGTFVRITGAQELFHGDYLFVGQQLLRVEIA